MGPPPVRMPDVIPSIVTPGYRNGAPHRRRLLTTLLLGMMSIIAVTVVVITVSEPLVHGWNDTIGFGAGLLTAVATVWLVLRFG